MAKVNGKPKPKDIAIVLQGFDTQHLRNIVHNKVLLDQIYDDVCREASRIGGATGFNDPALPFELSDYPQAQKRIDKLLADMGDKIQSVVEEGDKKEWLLSAQKNATIIDMLANGTGISKEKLQEWKAPNMDALEAFQQRKTNGMNLSQRVWNITAQTKQELELALDIGLGEGKSASDLSRDVRKFLNEPEKLFRRVRDKHGVLHLSKRAQAYHPGMGVYRSSYKNALRMTATETNMAYRTADHDKWGQLDFVIGQHIQLSNNHTIKNNKGEAVPFHDICDEMVGDYPKAFKFTGWHPFCRCFSTPILADWDEQLKVMKMQAEGKDVSDYHYKGEVTEMPEGFNKWIADNQTRIENASTLPYFIKDNYVDGDISKGFVWKQKTQETEIERIARERHSQRNDEEVRQRYNEYRKRRELERKVAENIVKVAKDYPWVDESVLQDLLTKNRTVDLVAETKRLAQEMSDINKWEKQVSCLIPDVKKWENQFSQKELQATYNSVDNNLHKWKHDYSADAYLKKAYGTEEEYIEHKLKFQINHTITVGSTKYNTWKVAEEAYTQQATHYQQLIKINKIKADLPNLKAVSSGYTTKLNKLIKDVEDCIAVGDYVGAESAHQNAVSQANYINKIRAKKVTKVSANNATKAVTFKPDDYSQKRKDNAFWAREHEKDKGDSLFRPHAEDDWKKWDKNTKEVTFLYTDGSSYINEPARGATYYGTKLGVHNEVRDSWKDINTLTTAIDKTKPFERDVWLNRGQDVNTTNAFFGIDLQKLGVDYKIRTQNIDRLKVLEASLKTATSKADIANIQREINKLNKYNTLLANIEGTIGQNNSFTSTAHTKCWGFVGDGKDVSSRYDVTLNIYCPKGTKGIYTEPYSRYGYMGRNGYNWDGKTKEPLCSELEVILQRGTKYRITKVEYREIVNSVTGAKHMHWFIDVDLIEQPVRLPNVP